MRLLGQLFDLMPNQDAAVPTRLTLLTLKAAPLLVNVAFSRLLVDPTRTLPNLRPVGLTDAAGTTVSVFDLVMPLAVPEIDAVLFASTGLVTNEKGADCSP